MTKRRQPEQQFQQGVAKLLDMVLAPPVEWTAIGHGGGGAVRGALLKTMGLKPGWPDIIISVPIENARLKTSLMVGLELKAEKGVLSHSQKLVHAALERSGWHMFSCKTLDEVLAALDAAGVPHRPVSIWPTGAMSLTKERVA